MKKIIFFILTCFSSFSCIDNSKDMSIEENNPNNVYIGDLLLESTTISIDKYIANNRNDNVIGIVSDVDIESGYIYVVSLKDSPNYPLLPNDTIADPITNTSYNFKDITLKNGSQNTIVLYNYLVVNNMQGNNAITSVYESSNNFVWFIPSYKELMMIHQSINEINSTLVKLKAYNNTSIDLIDNNKTYYMTNTWTDDNLIYVINIYNGYIGENTSYRNDDIKVRSITRIKQ